MSRRKNADSHLTPIHGDRLIDQPRSFGSLVGVKVHPVSDTPFCEAPRDSTTHAARCRHEWAVIALGRVYTAVATRSRRTRRYAICAVSFRINCPSFSPSGRTNSLTRSRSTSATMICPISVLTTVKIPKSCIRAVCDWLSSVGVR